MNFTNPLLLAGLAAVGLPVLIHFLTRARPRRIAFPPFKFLIVACAGQQAVHRLRTLILLTVRCLAVLALVLLFARPFLKPRGPSASPEAARRVVLVIDASLSMRAIHQGVPLFARAQAEAADVLRSLDSGSEAAVVLIGATPRPLLPALSRNIPALHDVLVQTQPTFENGDVAAALALAKKLLGDRPGTLYLFSDFQQSNWTEVGRLPALLNCHLRRAAPAPVENVALTSVQLSPAEPVAGEAAEVTCTVFNYTQRPRQETVRLELADFAQEKRVTVQPFSSAEAAFSVSFPQPGPITGKATLPPDDLREDNTRYLALRVHKALQLLLVSDADAGDRRSAAYFVNRALAPSAHAAPGLGVVRRHSQDADRGILETADVFVLVAPATLTGEAVEIISRRVKDGGQLIVFLDGPTAPSLTTAAFAPPFQVIRTLTSQAGEPVLAGPRKLFGESDATDWTGVRFRRHFETQLLDGRRDDVLLFYPDGAAALALSPVGKGRAVFANLPLTPDASDFVGSPMFPTMLHELLRALRRGAEERAVTPGMAWTLEATTLGEGVVTVSGPDEQKVEARVVASGRTTRLALPSARLPGTYLAAQSGTVVGAGAVNVDPRESDTRPIALEKLKPGTGATAAIAREEGELLVSGKTRPLWPLLAGTAATLLALEMALLAVWRRKTVNAGVTA